MMDASVDRLSVSTPAIRLPGRQRFARTSVVIAMVGAGFAVAMRMLSVFSVAPEASDPMAIQRIASMVLLVGLGFIALLAFEALAGRSDDEGADESASL
ncbi:MAG: hypothetical protein ACQGVC_20845 [Myxococcota bacterium]